MPETFEITRRITLRGGPTFKIEDELTCDASHSVPEIKLPAGLSHYEIAFSRDTLRVAVIGCNKPITIKTNDPEDPGDILPLKAGKMLTWDTKSGVPNPFRNDVESIYVDAPEGGNLTVLWGTDPRVEGPARPGDGVFDDR